MPTAVIFKVAFPPLVSVTFCVVLLPALTLLKANSEGLIVICACVAVPDPVKLIVSGDPGALLVIETLPLTPAVDVGANFTVNVLVSPGLMV
jgi:hypothetical protein